MKLTIAKKETTKPKGMRNGGRKESPEWAELVEIITSQTPGEWVTYKELDGTTDAVRVGQRLRQATSYNEGKALAPLKGKVKVALTGLTVGKEGKQVGTLAISYQPEVTKVTKPKAATKRATAKKS